MGDKTLFEQYLFEAPDDPPDAQQQDASQETPPDTPEDQPTDDAPPDMPDTADDDTAPPDLEDDGTEDFTNDDAPQENEQEPDENKTLGLDDKVSAIMNTNLYQRFLTLLERVAKQQQMLKTNMDVFYTISPDSLSIVKSLNNLDENIRMYLSNNFKTSNYSKNLLFFNKCLNLLKLLNDSFDKTVHKGIKEVE